MSLLRAEGLERYYGGRKVVDVAEFVIEPGEVVVLLGPNGAGKSTLFRLLLLLERADAGRIVLDGREVRSDDREVRQRLAGIFQRPFLFAGTVSENVEYGLRVRGWRRRRREARVAEVLELVGLAHLARASARTLSGGEARRVALARALAIRPDLLLLDEPTANLDVTARRGFRDDLFRLVRAESQSALLITHDPVEALQLADRIAVMQAGRIVQSTTPSELVREPGTPFIAEFTGAEFLLDGVVIERDERLVLVKVAGAADPLTAVLAVGEAEVEIGSRVVLSYRPEDVTLSPPDTPAETSARNRYVLGVTHLSPAGGLVRVRLEGELTLFALVTRPAADALGLVVGQQIAAHLKATALRAFRSSDTSRTWNGTEPVPT